MQHLGYIGQFLSGLAFLITACIAILTLLFYHRKQLDDAWLDRFRDLYKEFWGDKDMVIVRHLINNDEGYRVLELILVQRNSMKDCDVSWENYQQLELVDKFCSIMARVRSFGKSIAMSEVQEEIWGDLFLKFWVKRINDREEMRIYISKHWPGLLDQVNVKRKKKYIIL